MCSLKLGFNSFKGFKLTTWLFIGPFWIWQSLLLMLLIWASVGLKTANSPSLLSYLCSEVVYTLLQLVAEPIVSLGMFLWCLNRFSFRDALKTSSPFQDFRQGNFISPQISLTGQILFIYELYDFIYPNMYCGLTYAWYHTY